jgi:arsenite methyltransferase
LSISNAYESKCMNDTLGQTLRPGEFKLTEKAIELCNLTKEDKILDLGCGMGATISYLYENYKIKGVGIDPSEKLLSKAKENCPIGEFVKSQGEELPFPDESFDCVFAECTLSLMSDLNAAIHEVNRVLKKDGWFVVTDVYSKNPSALQELESYSFQSCMRGLYDLELLQKKLKDADFQIVYMGDYSDLLKELMVKIIFTYGSMDVFWSKAASNDTCTIGCEFQEKLKLCKPGYFILIGKKGEV